MHIKELLPIKAKPQEQHSSHVEHRVVSWHVLRLSINEASHPWTNHPSTCHISTPPSASYFVNTMQCHTVCEHTKLVEKHVLSQPQVLEVRQGDKLRQGEK